MAILLSSPNINAQQFLLTFPGGASVRVYFEYPSTISPGSSFTVTAFAEHVVGSPALNLELRFSTQPIPYIRPSSTDRVNIGFLAAGAQRSDRISFDVSPSTPRGAILVIKVDARDILGPPSPWQYVADLQITIPPVTTTTTITTTTTPTITPPKSSLKLFVTPMMIEKGKQTIVTISVNGLSIGDTAIINLVGAGISQTLSISGSEPIREVAVSPTSEGMLTVSVSAPGYTGDTTAITVVTPPFPWPWIAVISAAGIIGVLAIYLFTRRPEKPPPTPPPIHMELPPKPPKPGVAHRPQVVEVRKKKG
jgi:hypothetical protein